MYNDFSEHTLPEYISLEQCKTEKLFLQATMLENITFWATFVAAVCIVLFAVIVCLYDWCIEEKRMRRLEEKIDELCRVQEKVRTV